MKAKNGFIDFTKKPYKGVLSEVARDLGVTQQAVSQAVTRFQNPRILTLVEKKVRERRNAVKRYKSLAAAV